ncbi:MAG: acetyl-CoA carboxylase biotin carboxyl carrier protein [Gemmataceae bacterium]|nr:acetyl-CoA carboxylase biotin carboxyl carrier protein [Gemmataceae bacterium]
MADEPSKGPAPFDVRTIKALVALMTQHDLSEIDLRDGVQRIRLRRGTNPLVSTLSPAPQPASSSATAALAPNSQDPGAAAPSAKKLIDVKSQTVGTFYSAPNPGAEPFVKVGSRVTPNSVVGLIEAMKLFNEINAECSGVVVEILVDNQQPVEFGQVLMRVDPTA